MTTNYFKEKYGVEEKPSTRLAFLALVPVSALCALVMHNAMMFIIPAAVGCVLEFARYKASPFPNAVRSVGVLLALVASTPFWWWPFHDGVYVAESRVASANRLSNRLRASPSRPWYMRQSARGILGLW